MAMCRCNPKVVYTTRYHALKSRVNVHFGTRSRVQHQTGSSRTKKHENTRIEQLSQLV